MKFRYHHLPLLAGLALAPVSRSQDAPAADDAPPQAPSEVPAAGIAGDQAADAPAVGNQAGEVPGAVAKPYLGVSTSPVPGFLGKHINLQNGDGLLVRAADPGGPAAQAGLEVDDVITKVNGAAVGTNASLADSLKELQPGDEIELDTIHLGKAGKVTLKLAARPAHQAQAGRGAIEGALDVPGIEGFGQNLMERIPPGLRQQIEDQVRGAMEQGLGMGLEIAPGEGDLQIIPPGDGQLKGGAFQLNIASDITVVDGEGSVSLKKSAEGTRVRVLDHEGNEVWSGPWETEQDKAAAPPDIRQRINRANINVIPRLNVKPANPKREDGEAPHDDENKAK